MSFPSNVSCCPLCPLELQSQLDTTTTELKEEKLDTKRYKSELTRTQDELAEIKTEKESAETVPKGFH